MINDEIYRLNAGIEALLIYIEGITNTSSLQFLQTFNRQGENYRIWQINGDFEDSFGTVVVGE